MADMSDVAQALVTLIDAAVYPHGDGQAPVESAAVRIYQGWPDPDQLDADMAAAVAQPPAPVVHVTIYPLPGEKITSLVMGDGEWQEASNNGATGVAIRELRRQTKQFQITTWAPTPALRDQVAISTDVALAATTRLTMPDGSQALVSYVHSRQRDEQQKQLIYRRDIIYAVDYALTQTDAEYTIKQTVLDVIGGPTSTATGPEVTLLNPEALGSNLDFSDPGNSAFAL
ncbi:hypothetical protein [Sphingomonas sp.]|uniref:hypothetical protein n=1 Tax=Sphingomonas sp. TaxID=28214 RepID=UPI0025EA6005|nr:hypothetical protein [Sphingomonas sp.]MBV9528248.1 hypothetical protein [Sphingomonas sp.]